MTARYADMLSAMGTEPRLRIVRLLLATHPEGMVVGEIGSDLDIPSSTLSHRFEKLKSEDLVRVRREGTYLWYSANTAALLELLGFLRAMAGDGFDVVSAGSEETPLDPDSVEAMREVGIDISGQETKAVNRFSGATFQLCRDAV